MSVMGVPSLEAVVLEMARDQHGILVELRRRTPDAFAGEYRRRPRTVKVVACGQRWLGVRHGAGYCFTGADGRIIDAHDQLAAPPFPIDPHAVVQYAQSRGLSAMRHDGALIPVEHRAVGAGLRGLTAVGVLEADRRPPAGRERFVRAAAAIAVPATEVAASLDKSGRVERAPEGRMPLGYLAARLGDQVDAATVLLGLERGWLVHDDAIEWALGQVAVGADAPSVRALAARDEHDTATVRELLRAIATRSGADAEIRARASWDRIWRDVDEPSRH